MSENVCKLLRSRNACKDVQERTKFWTAIQCRNSRVGLWTPAVTRTRDLAGWSATFTLRLKFCHQNGALRLTTSAPQFQKKPVTVQDVELAYADWHLLMAAEKWMSGADMVATRPVFYWHSALGIGCCLLQNEHFCWFSHMSHMYWKTENWATKSIHAACFIKYIMNCFYHTE